MSFYNTRTGGYIIDCVNCGSPDCRGCNVYTLAEALRQGKLDWAMNENRSIRIENLNMYHALAAEGRLITLPCSPGTPVYVVRGTYPYDNLNIAVERFMKSHEGAWGVRVFPTFEEAEAAQKKLLKGGGKV